MDQWFRRSILTGLAGTLAACASHSDRNADPDWLLGQWQGAFEGQLLTVTYVNAANEMALGTWAGRPVTILVAGSKLRFVTADDRAVQLAYTAGATLVGTVDRAPWLVQARTPVGFLALRRITPPGTSRRGSAVLT